jgi:hypothetical protein
LRIPAIAAENAKQRSLTRFLIATISSAARSRSSRSFSVERRTSNSAICAVSVVTLAAKVSRLFRARARSRLRVSTNSAFLKTSVCSDKKWACTLGVSSRNAR